MRFLAALLLALLLAGGAQAQDALPVATCGTLPLAYKPGVSSRVTVDLNGNLCISGNITASATTVVSAIAALPTLAPGNQTPTASLAGAAYAQPVFGSASGGGTQVDATHGLPVNIVGGGGAGGTASSYGAAFPATGTAAGFKDGGGLMQPAIVDGSGNQNVNIQATITLPISAASLPLPSGAATSTKQPAIGTAGTPSADVISVQGETSMTPLKVDGSAVTQPVSAASLPLPAGASTAAKQPALGTAGTASSDVITVQGITAMTPLKVDGSGVTQPVSGTVTANQGGTWTVQPGNTANTTAWKVDGSAVTQPVSGTVTSNQGSANATPWNENVAQIAGTAPAMKASGANAATTDTALVVAPSPNPSTVCASSIAVNQTSSTDLVTSTNKLHICAIFLISASAQNISLVEGTGSVCATGIAALIGGTTASVAVAANGGFSAAAERAWLVTKTTADHLCLEQSGAGNVSGVITYTDHN